MSIGIAIKATNKTVLACDTFSWADNLVVNENYKKSHVVHCSDSPIVFSFAAEDSAHAQTISSWIDSIATEESHAASVIERLASDWRTGEISSADNQLDVSVLAIAINQVWLILSGSLAPIEDFAAIGYAKDFVTGYLAAANRTDKLIEPAKLALESIQLARRKSAYIGSKIKVFTLDSQQLVEEEYKIVEHTVLTSRKVFDTLHGANG